MDCIFCGEEFEGRPVRQDGQIYCSIECAETAREIGTDYDDFELDDFQDDSLDMDYYEEVDEY